MRMQGVSALPDQASCPASHLSPTCPAPLPSRCGSQGGARWASYEDLGQGIGTRTGNEGLAGVARDSVNSLFMLLAVGCDLLHACFIVQAPQTQGTVVTYAGVGAERAAPRTNPSSSKPHPLDELALALDKGPIFFSMHLSTPRLRENPFGLACYPSSSYQVFTGDLCTRLTSPSPGLLTFRCGRR